MNSSSSNKNDNISPASPSGDGGGVGNTKPIHPMLDPTACKELKDRHDTCFYKWYSGSFLKGNISQDCQEEWEEYQVCIKDKLKAWNLEHLLSDENKKK